MASVSTYLDFNGQTEAAFEFYKSIFKTDYAGPIYRIKDPPPAPGKQRTEEQGNRIAHMALPILGGHVLRGTDVPELRMGDNIGIMLEPDSRSEAEELYGALSAGGGKSSCRSRTCSGAPISVSSSTSLACTVRERGARAVSDAGTESLAGQRVVVKEAAADWAWQSSRRS